MTIPLITAIPDRQQAPDTFETTVPTMLGQINATATAMNDAGTAVAGAQAAVLAAQASVMGAVYFRGAWSSLTGPLNMPSSVAHSGRVWVLTADLADVTTATPGVSSSWVPAYPQRRIAILDPSTLGLSAIGGAEILTNLTPTATGITQVNGAIASNGTAFIVTSAATTTASSRSTDGRTWSAPGVFPSSAVWFPVPCSSGVMLAFAQGVLNGGARSTDSGATWASMSLGGATTNTTLGKLCAGNAASSNVICSTNTISGAIVSTNAGASWSAVQTLPITPVDLWVLPSGVFVARQISSTAIYRSTTGLTGSWSSTTMPAGCDNAIQDSDGAILAWKANDSAALVYRSTDAVNFTSTGVVRQIFGTPRNFNGVYSISDGNGWAYTWHGSEWVPRRGPDMPSRSVAKMGNVHVYVPTTGTLVYLFDHSAADARKSVWE